MKVITSQIIEADEAYRRYGQSCIEFGIAIAEVREIQAYIDAGYRTFEQFVFERYGLRLRSAQYLAAIGIAFDRYGLKETELPYSKARLIAPKITEDNKDELVSVAQEKSVEQLQEYLKTSSLPTGVIHRLVVPFYNQEDADTVKEGIARAQQINGSQSIAGALTSMAQEFLGANGGIEEMHQSLDPVTRKCFERDGWMCCNPECKGDPQKNLNRHSHLQPHSKAQLKHVFTLCNICHDLFTRNLATIEVIKLNEKERAVIKFIVKGEANG